MAPAIPTAKPMTIADYLAREELAETKSEFFDGELIDMAGSTEAHVLIAINFGAELRGALKGKPCRAYGTDLRVRVIDRPRYRYPDAMVICGQTEFDPSDSKKMSVTNPSLIVEVLSPSTTASDRGEKFRDYRAAPSFHTYVLASQTSPTVETYHRQPDGSWRLDVYTDLAAVVGLRTLGIPIPMSEIYAGVTFPEPPVL